MVPRVEIRYWAFTCSDLKVRFISCCVVPGNSDHNGVLLEVDWVENRHGTQVERIVSLYRKTDVLGLQAFLGKSLNYALGAVVALKRFGITLRI
jgi:hypothetical protein